MSPLARSPHPPHRSPRRSRWLALGLALLIGSTPAAAGPDDASLEALLRDHPRPDRNLPSALRRRRTREFEFELRRVVEDDSRPDAERLAAARWLGAVVDDPNQKLELVRLATRLGPGTLGTALREAVSAVEGRSRLRRKLARGDDVPDADRAELLKLAADPLEGERHPVLRLEALRRCNEMTPFPAAELGAIAAVTSDSLAARLPALRGLRLRAPEALIRLAPKLIEDPADEPYRILLAASEEVSGDALRPLVARLRRGSVTARTRICGLFRAARFLPAANALQDVARREDEAPELRVEAIRTLVALGRTSPRVAAPDLLRLLQVLPEEKRWRTLRALGELPRSATVEPLGKLFEAELVEDLLLAVETARALKLADLSESVIRLALGSEQPQLLRAAATRALGDFPGDRSARALIRLLGSSPLLARSAVLALARPGFRRKDVRAALTKLLESPRGELHDPAIRALGIVGDASTLSRLRSLLAHEDLTASRLESLLIALDRLTPVGPAPFTDAGPQPEAGPTPTQAVIERSVAAVKARIGRSDDADVLRAALSFQARRPGPRLVETCLDGMAHRQATVRSLAWRELTRVLPPSTMGRPSGRDPFGYDPLDPPDRRRKALARWREWWSASSKTLPK